MDWKKGFMYGSFIAGAVLFVAGRRSAGIAVAGIGLATFALEYPEKLEEIWQRAPEYLEKSGRVIETASSLLDRLSSQQANGSRNLHIAR